MSIFSYHIVTTSYLVALRALLYPPRPTNHPGLVHAECMTAMTLGSGIFSPSRMLLRQLVVFAQWESEEALNHFLVNKCINAHNAVSFKNEKEYRNDRHSSKGLSKGC